MQDTKLICGSCNINITESEETYLEKHHEDGSKWFQCFDCYCEEEEHFYNEDESYADFYCRTDCSCCSNGDHHQWDEEE